MKIKRIINNQEIEIDLTPDEIRNAHEEYHLECIKYDILSRYTSNDETALKRATAIAENILDKNDGYLESYWASLDYAAEEAGMTERDEYLY